MKTFVLAAACGLAVVAGCQKSHDTDVDTTSRPPAKAETDAGAASYTVTGTATRDTEWAASTDAAAAKGTLRAGDRVMFNRMPDTSTTWQQARTMDGRTVYVRPADFRVTATSTSTK